MGNGEWCAGCGDETTLLWRVETDDGEQLRCSDCTPESTDDNNDRD